MAIKQRILFDVTATLESGLETGIQKVVKEWARGLSEDSKLKSEITIIPIFVLTRIGAEPIILRANLANYSKALRNEKLNWYVILGTIIAFVRSTNCGRLIYDKVIRRQERLKKPFRKLQLSHYFKSGIILEESIVIKKEDIIFEADAFWSSENSCALIDKAIQSRCKLYVFVHDLLPLSHPHLFEKHATELFRFRMYKYLPIVDRIYISTNFTRNSIRKYFGKEIEILKVDLGQDVDSEKREKYFPVFDFKYSLAIGTIEPRKNYELILNWFLELQTEEKLIIVGRQGWNSKKTVKRIRYLERNTDRIMWLDSVDNTKLNNLIHFARYGICASIVEGYGLPLREFLYQDIPVVASNIEAFQELSKSYQEKVRYFELDDKNSFFKAIDSVRNIKRNNSQNKEVLSWKESTIMLISTF